jgi:pyruvate dehydrogenase E2 component (dihydrolipoamide acetyltransferase)
MEDSPEYAKITITDIIIYAASRVLPKHRCINAHFLGDKMVLFNNAHIGVAVDTPRGLLVPTIFNTNSMSLSEISVHSKELFEKCKKGSIEPDLLKGASFTISNLGSFGIEMFTPILNPPQTGILGVCNAIERTKNGKPYPALGLSVTYDHQALDGADSARFLKDLVQYLENFASHLLIDGGLL